MELAARTTLSRQAPLTKEEYAEIKKLAPDVSKLFELEDVQSVMGDDVDFIANYAWINALVLSSEVDFMEGSNELGAEKLRLLLHLANLCVGSGNSMAADRARSAYEEYQWACVLRASKAVDLDEKRFWRKMLDRKPVDFNWNRWVSQEILTAKLFFDQSKFDALAPIVRRRMRAYRLEAIVRGTREAPAATPKSYNLSSDAFTSAALASEAYGFIVPYYELPRRWPECAVAIDILIERAGGPKAVIHRDQKITKRGKDLVLEGNGGEITISGSAVRFVSGL